MKKALRITGRILLILLGAFLIFTLVTFIIHRVKRSSETDLLREKGCVNPVSVGDHALNVSKVGNENGRHTVVAMAGLGMGDYSVTFRQMTAAIEPDELVVFVDRAGYGLSDDTDHEMTLDFIVEDYRTALKNAGIPAPYVLMPHSIGGAYANYWSCKYPEEIEGIVFVDGSQLSADAFADEDGGDGSIGLVDRLLTLCARLGFSRYVLRDYEYRLPDNYSEEEQYLADALALMTLESDASTSESCLIGKNAQEAWESITANDIPKRYICASWGIETKDDLILRNRFRNRDIELNHRDISPFPTEYADDDAELQRILAEYRKAREDVLYPYAEKMGNCEVVCLAGDHLIYQQRPAECGALVKEFLDSLGG